MNSKVFLWIGGIASLMYIGLGNVMLFMPPKFNFQHAFGGLLIAYGLFRGYRVYRTAMRNKKEEEFQQNGNKN